MLENLREEIDESSYDIWLSGVFACDLADGALSIVVPNAAAEEYVASRFGAKIEEALKRRLDFPVSLRVLVGERA